jgi:hypothetical protein
MSPANSTVHLIITGEGIQIRSLTRFANLSLFWFVGIGILIKIIIMMALLVNGAGFSGANVLL